MRLLYFADPMCSWCYGFGPELRKLLAARPDLQLELVMGGLRPFNRDPMSDAFREMLASHWQHVAPADAVAAYAWIAVKHEITYRRPAFLGDNVIVSVELEKVQRESAFYETVVRRGDEILADVKSRWCCLDAASLRPARLASAIVEHFMSGEN